MGTVLAAFPGIEMFGGQGIKKETAIAQFMTKALGLGVTLVWSVVATIIIVFICIATVGLRVPDWDEETGLELAEHGEPSYTLWTQRKSLIRISETTCEKQNPDQIAPAGVFYNQ